MPIEDVRQAIVALQANLTSLRTTESFLEELNLQNLRASEMTPAQQGRLQELRRLSTTEAMQSSRGTGFLVKGKRSTYLVSALHVLFDERKYSNELCRLNASVQFLILNGHTNRLEAIKEKIAKLSQSPDGYIYSKIMLIPSFDDPEASDGDGSLLMNAETAFPIVIKPEFDLIVISLSKKWPSIPRTTSHQEFLDRIEQKYTPIPMESLADGPSRIGAEIYTIGFPANGLWQVADFMKQNDRKIQANWLPWYKTLPIATFGRVAMVHPKYPVFIGDMTIFGGNSGGPVLEGDKLVGYISKQSLDTEHQPSRRWPLAHIQKAKAVRDAILKLDLE